VVTWRHRNRRTTTYRETYTLAIPSTLSPSLYFCLLFSSTLIPTDRIAAEEFREDFERYQVDQPLGTQSKWQGGRPERTDEATALVVAGGIGKSRQAAAIVRDGEKNRIFSITHAFPKQNGVVWVDVRLQPAKNRAGGPALDLFDGRRGATHVVLLVDISILLAGLRHSPRQRVSLVSPDRTNRLPHRHMGTLGRWQTAFTRSSPVGGGDRRRSHSHQQRGYAG